MSEIAGMHQTKTVRGKMRKSDQNIQQIVQQIFADAPANERRQSTSVKVQIYEALIIGDLHLGSRKFKAEKILKLLEGLNYKRLIINGDIFARQLPDKLPASHLMVLNILQSLTMQENGIEVIWLEGNSDRKKYIQKYLPGINFRDKFELEWNHRRVLILHGHVFDRKIYKKSVTERLLRLALKPFPFLREKRAQWIKSIRNKKQQYEKDALKVREGAVNLAREQNADIVICGHSHQTEYSIVGTIRYINPGAWVDAQNYFIGLGDTNVDFLKFSDVFGSE